MATNNRLWGAERIRGELLKLDIHVSKRTIQKYMKQARPKRAQGQSWKVFLRNHAAEVWACDFLQVTDLFFRPLFAFFMIELKSRKVIHVNVTRTRPHQGLGQRIPDSSVFSPPLPNQGNQIRAVPNIRWVTPRLPKSSLNQRSRMDQG